VSTSSVPEATPAALEPIAVGTIDLDPIADVETKKPKNRSRVGAIRPSAMLYTQGIGATVDLPHLSMMPHGLDTWDAVYSKRPGPADVIVEPRLLDVVRAQLGSQVTELRKPPWAPAEVGRQQTAVDLGIPGRIFPQWLRCTGCGELAQVSDSIFEYENTNPYRPDQARFVHRRCPGWSELGKSGSRKPSGKPQPAVPARYLIACPDGHLDEFPYVAWVHRGKKCTEAKPRLRMREWKSNIGPDVQITCKVCKAARGMLEATGPAAAKKLPMCRGRHPHLDAFFSCDHPGKLMMLGAANQWFSNTVGLLALPRDEAAGIADLVPRIQALPPEILAAAPVREALPGFKIAAGVIAQTDIFDDVDDDLLWEAIQIAAGTVIAPRVTANEDRRRDPRSILAPEWSVLTDEAKYTSHSGATDFRAVSRSVPPMLSKVVSSVVAVEKLKKVNAFVGFTRIDAFDRIDDASTRVAPLRRSGRPTWIPATEDRGEGVFLQFDEGVVAAWEAEILIHPVWEAFRQAHRLNFERRTSKTASDIDPDGRFPSPRYWAIHTLSHLLIRQMAMSSGYGSASLAERIYAWPADDHHPAAAGLLITTTASDSEGTLGGLVELARPQKLSEVLRTALRRGRRCSSDPICSHRVPKGKEDFLHGAACHFCLFISETSCERTNRFLDRRLLLGLVAEPDIATPGLLESLVEVH
jgi:hypothetical protein